MSATERLRRRSAGMRAAASAGFDYDPEAKMEYDQDQEEARDLSRGPDGNPGTMWQNLARQDW